MHKHRALIAVGMTIAAGMLTARFVPSGWLANCFWGAGFCAFVFAVLAASSARDPGHASDPSAAERAALWLIVGTDRPTAAVTDKQALVLFFLALAFLAGLTLETFASISA